MAEPRFKPLAESEMTPEQRRVAAAISAGPRGNVRGPFWMLLRAPELADRAQRLGEYVRFHGTLPAPLRELAILVTARFWSAQYEWHAHQKLGREAGLAEAVIGAIAEGKRPASLSPDEAIIYDFCTELLEKKDVGDATFGKARERFGETAVVELVGTMGHYCVMALVLNTARHPLPEGAKPLPPLKK